MWRSGEPNNENGKEMCAQMWRYISESGVILEIVYLLPIVIDYIVQIRSEQKSNEIGVSFTRFNCYLR